MQIFVLVWNFLFPLFILLHFSDNTFRVFFQNAIFIAILLLFMYACMHTLNRKTFETEKLLLTMEVK